jgi:predicted nucleic acid-binding protein
MRRKISWQTSSPGQTNWVAPANPIGIGKNCMTGLSFVDSNVFVYAVDGRDERKKEIARTLIARLTGDHSLITSTQVMLEFFRASTQKVGYPEKEALAALQVFFAGDVVPATADLVRSAAEISILDQLSIWDSMIVAAATLRRCETLFSEDFTDGKTIRGLRVRNPFRQ